MYRKGLELERDPEYMEDIADVIRAGIAEAERELKNEADGEVCITILLIFTFPLRVPVLCPSTFRRPDLLNVPPRIQNSR